MGRLVDKIAVVTGAGQGIGKAIAEKLAHEGATVVVTDRNARTAEQTAEGLPGGAVGLTVDVTDRASVAAMVDEVTAPASPASTSWSTTPGGTRPARSSTPIPPTGTRSSGSTCTAC